MATEQQSIAKYRAVQITLDRKLSRKEVWEFVWGADIWINNVPTLKTAFAVLSIILTALVVILK